MKNRVLVLCAAMAFVGVAPVTSAQQEDTMSQSEYVVMPHMEGSLALQVSSISGLWYQPATEEKACQLRVLSQSLSGAKTLAGEDADALWGSFRDRGADFIFVDHMGGTLAIPRAQLRTAYYSEDSGAPRLRLAYDGDPGGKTLQGEEATRVWQDLRR